MAKGKQIATAYVQIIPSMQGIKQNLADGFGKQQGTVNKQGNMLGRLFSNAFVNSARQALSSVSGVFSSAFSTIGAVFNKATEPIKAAFSRMGDMVLKSKLVTSVSSVYERITSTFSSLQTKLTTSVQSAFSRAANAITSTRMGQFATSAASSVVNAFSAITPRITGIMSKLPPAFQNIGSSMASRMTSSLKRGFSTLGNVIGSLPQVAGSAALAAGAAVGAKLLSGISGGIKRFDTLNNFPKVMKNMGISADASTQVINELSTALKGLPTPLDAGAAAVQRLTSKNGDIGKSKDLFLAMNNAILAGGQSYEIQQSAMEQLSQAYSKGRMDMMEWRTLQMAMPAQLKQVADAMGMTSDALGEGLRDGSVSMDEFMAKLVELNKEGVNGLGSFEEQARAATGGIETSMGLINTAISRGWEKLLSAFGSERMQKIFEGITNAFDTLFQKLEPVASALGQGFDEAVKNVGQAIENFLPLIGVLGGAFVALSAGGIGTLLTSLPIVGGLFAPLGGVFAALTGPIGLAIGAFLGLVAVSEPLQQALGELGRILMETLMQAFEKIMTAIEPIIPVASDLVQIIGTLLADAINALLPIIELLGQIFLGVVDFVIGAFQLFVGIITGDTDLIKQAFGKMGEGINRIIDALVDFIINGFKNFVEFVKNIPEQVVNFFESLPENLGNIFTRAGETIKAVFEGLLDFIMAIPKKIQSIFSKISLKIPDVKMPGIAGGARPNLRWYAKGGIFNSPSVIGVGEAGREAVLPIDKLQKFVDFGKQNAQPAGNIYINGVQIQVDSERKKNALLELFGAELSEARLGVGGVY